MRSSFVALFLLLLPSMTFAWGGDGHQITCLIAEDRLAPAAKAGIRDLLGADVNISDAEIASWADEYKRQHRETGPWHYVDIPSDAAKYDPKRDGRDGANVIDKINEFEKVLADTGKPKNERAEALKFLVHLVGDVHQPLHCAERDGDRGGNAVKVKFLNRQSVTNLHTCWDSLILLNHKGRIRIAEYAEALNAKITDKQAHEWAHGSPEDWSNEAHEIAVKVIYATTPPSTQPTKMDQSQVDRDAMVVDEQLQRGGVRLATILNHIFK